MSRLSGPEKAPNAGSCCAIGFPNLGPGSEEVMSVTGILVDPVVSVATKPKFAAPVSFSPGVPYSMRAELSKFSHCGALDNAYCSSCKDDVKVEPEKTN